MAQMAGLLAALPRNGATVFQQLLEKKSQESGVESPEPEDEGQDGEAPEASADVADETAQDQPTEEESEETQDSGLSTQDSEE